MKKMGNEKTTKAIAARLAVLFITLAMLFTSMPFGLLTYANEAEDTQAATEQSTDAASQTQTQTEPKDKASETPNTEPKDTPTETPKAEPKEEPKKETQKEESKDESNADAANEDPDNGVLEVSSPVGSYTVDFYFTAEDGTETEYHLKGGSEIMLSELFAKLGINRDTADIKKTVFTDNELVKFVKEGDDYRVISLKPFNTEESLTITFEDDEVVVLRVTDDVAAQVLPGSTDIVWEITDGKLIIRPADGKETGTLPSVHNIYNTDKETDIAAKWPWRNNAEDITAVQIKSGVKAAKEARHMFSGLDKLATVDMSGLDATNLEVTNDMFRGCKGLEKVTVEAVSFAPKQTQRMFWNCENLKEITLGSLEKPLDIQKDYSDETKAFNSTDNMFSGCSKLDTLNIPGVDTIGGNGGGTRKNTNFYNNLIKRFYDANDLPKALTMEKSKLGVYAAKNLFKYNKLDTLVLTGSEIAEQTLRYMFHDTDGTTVLSQNLRIIDMTSVKFTHASPTAFNMFRNMTNLEEVSLTDAEFPDTCTNYTSMFKDCTALQTVEMTATDSDNNTKTLSVKGATSMENMFENCTSMTYLDISGFGKLPNIVNMNNVIGKCTAMETLIIDNLDNSVLEPRRGSEHPHSTDGRMFFGWNEPSSTFTNLKKLSAKNSNVWFVKDNERGIPGKEYYNAAFSNDIYYLTNKVTKFTSDVESKVETIDSKRDWIDLITDHYGQSWGADTIPDAAHNINYYKNGDTEGHLNTNGAGHLAPGVYEIGTDAWTEPTLEFEDTYYRISNIDGSDPQIAYSHPLLAEPDGTNRVKTKVYTVDQWDSLFVKDGNDRIIKNNNDDPVITITYPNAAEDINGDKHNVILKINSITFKNVDRIKTSPGVEHDPNTYLSEGGSYYRDILSASTGTADGLGALNFKNYAYNASGTKIISSGSGTYIDFDIEVKDALPNTSILFYMEDLDVEAQQFFKPGYDPNDSSKEDWHYQEAPFKKETVGGKDYGTKYGPGSEGMILGAGNDLNTLKFAEHTGLERVNGNEIISTGGDPNTAWSSFCVRANASGSNYTWTSGVGCDTYLLKQTPPPSGVKDVYVMPELLKNVSGSAPTGIYFTEYFRFNMVDASSEVTKVPDDITEHKGLPNTVGPNPSLGTSRTNDGEYIYFGHVKLSASTTSPYKSGYVYKFTEDNGSSADDVIRYDNDKTYYIQIIVSKPTSDEELAGGTKAEIYIGEKLSSTSPIHWDTDHYITVWARDMQPAMEAETTEVDGNSYEVYKDGDDQKYYIIGDKCYRVTDNDEIDPKPTVKTPVYKEKTVVVDVEYPVYELDGVSFYRKEGKCWKVPVADPPEEYTPTPSLSQSVDTGNTVTLKEKFAVYLDANGKEFYRQGGKFWSADNKAEQSRTTEALSQNDKTVEYDYGTGLRTYTVYADHNGVEYFHADNGKYYTPMGKQIIPTEPGEVMPKDNDEIRMEEKQVDGEIVRVDVHGKEYIKKGSKYYDADNPATEIKVGDGEDGKFNPNDATDRKVFIEKKSDNGHTVKIDAYGVEYYEENGNYYNPVAPYKELSTKTEGDFNPNAKTDQPVKANLIAEVDMKEGRTGDGNTVYVTKDTPAIQYYKVTTGEGDSKKTTYYSVIGTILDPASSSFNPEDDDETVKITVDVMYDEGTKKQYYRLDGKNYEYPSGDAYTLGENTVETSEIPQVGKFNNVVKTSEITIKKTTENGKSGKFTYNIKFNNNFEPKDYVFNPAGEASDAKIVKADDWSATNNAWTFTLHEDQQLIIREVPFQTTYTITEIFQVNGWELVSVDRDTSKTSASKTITTKTSDAGHENDYTHVFKNRFTEIVVDKTVKSTSEDSTEFNFTAEIKVTGLKPKTDFSYGWMNGTKKEFFTAETDDSGEKTLTIDFKLKDGEDIDIVVPQGSTVKVKEDYDNRNSITEVSRNNGSEKKAKEIEEADVKNNPITRLHFTNKIIDPVELKIPVAKILSGRPWKADDKFAAGLTLVTNDAPMPDNAATIGSGEKVAEVVIDNKGKPVKDGDKVIGYEAEFLPITYKIDDIGKTYKYRVRELTPSESNNIEPIPGVTPDTEWYDVEVKVTLDDKTDPDKPKLLATVSYKNNKGETVTISRFTNVYDAEETDYKMEAVKDFYDVTSNKEIDLEGGDFEFVLRPIAGKKYADIAPMPAGYEGSGENRKYYKTNEDDGDIEFEGDPSQIKDGMVFNYKELLKAGVSDAELHSDKGVDFEYELYEVIPGTDEGNARGKKLTAKETLVNNENGTYSVIGDDYEIVYDGIHHTRKITVKVIAGEPTQTGKKHTVGGVEYDVLKDFNEVEYYEKDSKAYKVIGDELFAPDLETLDVEGHEDDHTACYYISEKDGTPKNIPMSEVEGYVPTKHHFKKNEHGVEVKGAPIFINYHFKQQYVDLKVNKVWDDADDQDEIRPKSVKLTIESDEGDYKPAALEIKGSTWTASEKLPVWKFDANTLELSEIEYTVKEDPVPTGYTVSYSPDASSITLDPSKTEFALTVTNKHVPGESDIEGDETYGLKGQEQTGTPKYDVNPKNPVTPTGLVKPEKEGATISDDGKTVTIPGEGKYVLNDDGTVTFTPDPEFVGDPTPVDVKGKDKQGNEKTATYKPHVKDSEIKENVKRTIHYRKIDKSGEVAAEDKVQEVTLIKKATKIDPKTGDITWEKDWEPATFPAADNPKVPGWYTNNKVEPLTVKESGDTEEYVIYKEPTIEGDKSYGLKGQEQTGTPNYEVDPDNPITPVKLVKPDKEGATISDDGKTVTIPGEGKYVLNDDGAITFTPEPEFVEDPTPVDVMGKDKHGNEVSCTYTPHVVDPEDKAEVKRIIKFTYEKKDGTPVTDSITQIGTIMRKALEVDPKTGEVTKWGPWSSYTFPAVKNPDKEAGKGWATKDIAAEMTVNGPAEVPDVYVIYHKTKTKDKDCPDCENGSSGAKTGDETNVAIWIALIAAAAASIIAVIIRRRRRS